jgi:hypothetical protein
MQNIMVKNQREYDAAPKNKNTQIIILDAEEPVTVPTSAADKDILKIEVRGNSHVIAHADADLYCYDNAVIEAFDNTHIFAFNSSKIRAHDHATISASDNTSVEAWDNVAVFSANNATVKTHDFCDTMAKNNSTVWAEDYAVVNAYDASSVYASGNSKVPNAFNNCNLFLSGQASAKAYDFARVSAVNSASVEAYNKTTVILGGKASVKAQDNTLVITDNRMKNISARHKSMVFDASQITAANFKDYLTALSRHEHFDNNPLLAASGILSCLPQGVRDKIQNNLVALGATNSEKMQTLFQSWLREEKNNGIGKTSGPAKNQNKGPEPER